jgi:hypothetical protein
MPLLLVWLPFWLVLGLIFLPLHQPASFLPYLLPSWLRLSLGPFKSSCSWLELQLSFQLASLSPLELELGLTLPEMKFDLLFKPFIQCVQL